MAGTREVAGIAITHPDRVIFPATGLTKAELAEYCAALGERFVAHAGNRPVSLLRCVGGLEGECFFQKHAGKGFPGEIAAIAITEASGRTAPYMTFETIAGAVAAVQIGTIEFHIWGARNDALETPDRLVFDLDPDEGLPFARVVETARLIREVLAELGLAATPMVTGGKGVHVVSHLRPAAGWDLVSRFARSLAQSLARRDPDRLVATMSKAQRRGKVFIDWLRNDRGATAIAPYSVRARRTAPVAVPVSWAELPALDAANCFSVETARKRLSQPCPLLAAPRDHAITEAMLGRLQRQS